MTSFGQQQPSMMSFSSGQAQDNNMLSLNSQQMNFQQGQPQMDLNMMQGNPNMMGAQQMNFPQGQPQMNLNMMQGNPNMMGGQQMNFQQGQPQMNPKHDGRAADEFSAGSATDEFSAG